MERWFGFTYPKLAGLLIAIVLAYVVFRNPTVSGFVSHMGSLSYLGVLLWGFYLHLVLLPPLQPDFS